MDPVSARLCTPLCCVSKNRVAVVDAFVLWVDCGVVGSYKKHALCAVYMVHTHASGMHVGNFNARLGNCVCWFQLMAHSFFAFAICQITRNAIVVALDV